jgi:hypothetical protein
MLRIAIGFVRDWACAGATGPAEPDQPYVTIGWPGERRDDHSACFQGFADNGFVALAQRENVSDVIRRMPRGTEPVGQARR